MTTECTTWRCRICKILEKTIDANTSYVCDACLLTVADKLCFDSLGVKTSKPGIDANFWIMKANYCISPMMNRWRSSNS